MLKRTVNHARIGLRIVPLDPLLIKSEQATVGGVDMSFVRTRRFGEAQPYIPGSSLKGVIRSYGEKICRSLRPDPVPVCLPYLQPGKEQRQRGEEGQASCGLRFGDREKRRKENTPSPDVYRYACPACRLFGCHCYIGRFSSSDAYLCDDPVLEIRDGVAIDRFTGGAAGSAKYALEVLTRGTFTAALEVRNFERWQLGLISLVLRDMEEGLVRVGFGKSRGLGRIRAEIDSFLVSYYGPGVETLKGLGSLCREREIEDYGFFEEGEPSLPLPPKSANGGLRHDHDITAQWKDLLDPAVDDLSRYLEQVDWPGGIEGYTQGRR